MMPDDNFVKGLRHFKEEFFPLYRDEYRRMVQEGQHPNTLFIGCSDSRIVPYMLMDKGPGELFIARNVGNIVPPFTAEFGYHGTAAAIEFAVLNLHVRDIVICGHSHCGAIRALYQPPLAGAVHLEKWLELARPAALPVQPSEDALRRTEQRSIILQLERLLDYPMVRERVERGELFLHGWHYILEEGNVYILDVQTGQFIPSEKSGNEAHTGAAMMDSRFIY